MRKSLEGRINLTRLSQMSQDLGQSISGGRAAEEVTLIMTRWHATHHPSYQGVLTNLVLAVIGAAMLNSVWRYVVANLQ